MSVRLSGLIPGLRACLEAWPHLSGLRQELRWRFGCAVALIVTLTFIDMLGVLLLVPLMRLVGVDMQPGTIGRIGTSIESASAGIGVPLSASLVLCAYVILVAARVLVSGWQTLVTTRLQWGLQAGLRLELYQAISRMTWLAFSRGRAADFSHVLITEIDRAGTGLTIVLALVADLALGLVYVAIALSLSGLAAGVVLLCGTALVVLLRTRIHEAHVVGQAFASATTELHGVTLEHLAGMKTSKGYGAQDRNGIMFSAVNERLARIAIETVRSHLATRTRFELGAAASLGAIVLLWLELFRIPLPETLLLIFLFNMIMPRIAAIHRHVDRLASLLPAFAAVQQLRARCEAAAEPSSDHRRAVAFGRHIRLHEVGFSYDPPPVAPAVDRLRLTLRVGSVTAIVGPSGAGKSTVADLVMGLLTPTHGDVALDECPLRPEHLQSWREQIGYVAQDTFLFHDTIRANLLWACPDVSEAQIWEALNAADAGFVAELPHGLDTIVGDRGIRLSGGERQRVALARALLRRPALLVLDEATSNLDAESERRIQHAIEQLHGHTTILVIAHRLSTVRNADMVYVLEDGKVVESGTWHDLATNWHGRLSAMWRAQGLDATDLRTDTGCPSTTGERADEAAHRGCQQAGHAPLASSGRG